MFICDGERNSENCCCADDCIEWNRCGDDDSSGSLKCWSFCEGGKNGEPEDRSSKCWSFVWFVFDGDCDWYPGKDVECCSLSCSCPPWLPCVPSVEPRPKSSKPLLTPSNIPRNGSAMMGHRRWSQKRSPILHSTLQNVHLHVLFAIVSTKPPWRAMEAKVDC